MPPKLIKKIPNDNTIYSKVDKIVPLLENTLVAASIPPIDSDDLITDVGVKIDVVSTEVEMRLPHIESTSYISTSLTNHIHLITAGREHVMSAYNTAKTENYVRLMEGDVTATSEYTFPNQIEDAYKIVEMFYKHNRRVVSVQKKTKVGADGLMIEIAKLMSTHPDDKFVVYYKNIRFITGMSNAKWEKDMIEKAPVCFKENIFHHGKLSKSCLVDISNSLIIIDEIDTGDKEYQVLHRTLKEAGVLDVEHMEKNNNRFVFISATMIKELYDLYRWGGLHELYKMIIPSNYIGHKDFLEMGIVKEFYSMNNAEKWVQEDIIDNYGTDYRVHIVRVNAKIIDVVQNACIRKGIIFRNHTSTDRLSKDDEREFFEKPLTQHIVLGVKGLLRRANLIPNRWKLRIGATHELYTKTVDNSVQIQGLTGRMTGYWRDVIEGGHKTGPHRTSIRAIEEYEINYTDPFGTNSYQTSGFKKKKGKVVSNPTMLSPKHILNLKAIDPPTVRQKGSMPIITFEITDDDKSKFNDTDAMLNILRKHNEDDYVKYKSYKTHCWKVDTLEKYEKWGINAMTKENAYSSETNITRKEKENMMNVLMIYLHDNRLFISPWNGEETNTS